MTETTALEFISRLVVPLLSTVIGGVAAYVAIRSDLATMRAQIEGMTKSIEVISKSIDYLLGRLDKLSGTDRP